MSTLFTLQTSELTNLGQDRTVEFFRRLLWAEAARVGIGTHLIDVPSCVNVGDGGIDAFVLGANPSSEELIPQSTIGYQIKSSDLSPKDCRKELHEKGDLDEPIKPEVKKILEQNGVYALVIFADISKVQRTNRENAIRDELKRLGYSNEVHLYTASQLIGFTERFPALIAWLKPERGQCQSYASWAKRRDVSIPKTFKPDSQRENWITEIRTQLRNPDDKCLVYRVMGLSGIGKTRFVFEILSADDLKHRVIYVDARSFAGSTLDKTLQNDSTLSSILVIDECSLNQHEEFVRAFSNQGSRLAVLTLSNEGGNVSHPTILYRLEPLAYEIIEEIVKAETPQLPNEVVRRISRFADGYPRIAVLLANSYMVLMSSEKWTIMAARKSPLSAEKKPQCLSNGFVKCHENP